MSATKGKMGSVFESVLQHQILPRESLFVSKRQYHLLLLLVLLLLLLLFNPVL